LEEEQWALSHLLLGTSIRDADPGANELLVKSVVRQPSPTAGAAQGNGSFELPLQPNDPLITVMSFAHPAGPISAIGVLLHAPHLAVTKVRSTAYWSPWGVFNIAAQYLQMEGMALADIIPTLYINMA
jgi:hypothetical protein